MQFLKLNKDQLDNLFKFEMENKDWFEQWVPPRADNYFQFTDFTRLNLNLIEEMNSGLGLFYLLLKDNIIVGRFNIADINSHFGDIGYRIAENQCAKGYGKMGLNLLVEQARFHKLKRLTASALEDNIASQRILESQDFAKINNERQPVLLNNIEKYLIHYELLVNNE
jgi:ribosomal-protein-alanine N-acetyltransferase